ncbi:restriction endonuclease subunit S [Parvimonas parva]|uniref:restriction endonuclease subunit S n=1 Tax=Parvimonas parva TaxID=2769485 RepID=UPI00061D41CB|nr:restriction endonuclease subunit S [Parvimonas parva]
MFDGLKSVNYTVKNLKDTFGISGRLDSEYYQEKYDRLFKKLSYNNCDKLYNLVIIKKSVEPGSERYQTKGIPFIRVQDLTKFGLTDTSIYLSENEFKTCIRPKKDTILLSKDGTVGIAYKMNKDEDIITSSAILHLNVKDKRVLPDYLTLVLNSVAVKMQAEKDAGGSIINHWKKSEIENVIIPIVEKKKQEQISKLLIESETLRSESKSILEKAVKSVEMAIECGEEKALYYLNSK